MNQNYPDYIVRKLREADVYESSEEELQELSPNEALEMILNYEGIFGYTSTILGWIQDIFKIKLSPYGETQSRQDFVQGLGHLFSVHEGMGGVRAMRMDDEDQVTIFFEGGGKHHANCAMDSKRAIISDILRQGF